MKKVLALMLALCMVLTVAALAETAAPDYVNLDSSLPFVKEGSEPVTLTLMAGAQDGARDPEETWQWKYLQEEGNIDLDITLVQWTDIGDKTNLLLAAGDIKDIMYNMQLNASQIVTYGQEEHILADLSGLIDAYAPDLKLALDKNPTHRAIWTTPDGAIYSLSNINDSSDMANYAMWVNKDWLDGIGMDSVPTTLDGFTDMLVQFKEKNPMGVEEEHLVPLGGYSGPDYPTAFILQALGFQINSFRQERIFDYAVVGDHCSVICCDDLYAEYLRICHDWFEKGLISQDYFTVDWKVTRAEAGLGYYGAYPQYGMNTIINNGFLEGDDATLESWQEKWLAASPLTSEWNDTPVALRSTGVTIGDFVVSEECENKEVAIRLANWFYTPEGNMLKAKGPMKDGDVPTYDLLDGWYWDASETNEGRFVIRDNEQLSIYSSYECLGYGSNKEVGETGVSRSLYLCQLGGHEEEYIAPGEFDLTTAAGRIDKQRYDAVAPYAVDGAPSILYMDGETAARVSDLIAVVSNYATSETAKFITGARPIEQVEDYLREIRAAGGDELNEIYNAAYQNYLANLAD